MKNGKIVGPNSILVEIWKCLGEQGLELLTKLYNVILRIANIANECRVSTVIRLYNNKSKI